MARSRCSGCYRIQHHLMFCRACIVSAGVVVPQITAAAGNLGLSALIFVNAKAARIGGKRLNCMEMRKLMRSQTIHLRTQTLKVGILLGEFCLHCLTTRGWWMLNRLNQMNCMAVSRTILHLHALFMLMFNVVLYLTICYLLLPTDV